MIQQADTPLEACREMMRMDVQDDGPLTDGQQQEVLAALKKIQKAENISHETMANILGCARPTWSQIANGVYPGNTEKYLREGRRFLAERASSTKAPATPYVRTMIGELIITVCQQAQQVPCIGKVIAPAGAGKTTAAREFCRRQSDRRIYLQAGECFNSKSALMQLLCRRLLNTKIVGNKAVGVHYEKVRQILSDYYAEGQRDPVCIVIDEATTLRPCALNMLRNLHDDDSCRAGIVLLDTGRLDAELYSRHGIAGGYEQLRSRLGAQYVLPADKKIARADVAAVAESVTAALGFGGGLDRAAIDYLSQLAQRDGKLRNVVYRLHAAHRVARAAKRRPAYTVKELDFVADLVGAEPQFPHQAEQAEQLRQTA